MEVLQVLMGVALALASTGATPIHPVPHHGLSDQEATDCLRDYEGGQCVPMARPDGCNEDAWQRLGSSLNPPQVSVAEERQLIGGTAGLPPAYLAIDNHDKCLGSESQGSHTSYCKLTTKPADCEQATFDQVNEVFSGRDCQQVEEWQLLGGTAGLPPAYLAIDNHDKCLGSQSQGSHTSYCKLTTKPADCEQATFDQVNEVFHGDLCAVEERTSFGPPAYLQVANANNCLKDFDASSTHSEVCLPVAPPSDCPHQSFLSLAEMIFQVQRERVTFPEFEADPNSLPKVSCDDDEPCRDGETCHNVQVAKYCVPLNRACDDWCPNIGGNLLGGILGADCVEGKCVYQPAIAIA